MRNVLFLVVLCSLAGISSAECVDKAPAATQARAGGDLIKSVAASDGVVRMQRTGGGEIVKTAALARPAATVLPAAPAHDDHANAPAAHPAKAITSSGGSEQPRAGTAMLLAALAVMLAIALRRTGVGDR